MSKINYYKLAPTTLYHKEHEPKVFTSQEEVDEAWEDGWFGPPWLLDRKERISEMTFASKADLIEAVRSDPRYENITGVKRNANLTEIHEILLAFEEDVFDSVSDNGNNDLNEDGNPETGDDE